MTPSRLIFSAVKLFCGLNKFSNFSTPLNSKPHSWPYRSPWIPGKILICIYSVKKNGCNSKSNKVQEQRGENTIKKKRNTRDNCFHCTFLYNFISAALMLVGNVKLKVSRRMFWLQGFMWVILIKALVILPRLFHPLCVMICLEHPPLSIIFLDCLSFSSLLSIATTVSFCQHPCS